jgi:hypothetical protein
MKERKLVVVHICYKYKSTYLKGNCLRKHLDICEFIVADHDGYVFGFPPNHPATRQEEG